MFYKRTLYFEDNGRTYEYKISSTCMKLIRMPIIEDMPIRITADYINEITDSFAKIIGNGTGHLKITMIKTIVENNSKKTRNIIIKKDE